jgi:uncharacterized protein
MEKILKPKVEPSDMSRPYWDAAAKGRLTLQGCGQCGLKRHYPQLLCSQCYSDNVVWSEASGRGIIHSWTVAHHAFHPGFAADLPYTLVTIDLEEGVRALGLWRSEVTPKIGLPVHGQFEPRDDGIDLVFRPVSNNTSL